MAWYTTLDIEDFTEWDHFAGEFIRQYKFNVEVLLIRKDLVRMEKRKNERFRAYAQRRKAVASQVKPNISENELIELFLKWFCNALENRGFLDVVIVFGIINTVLLSSSLVFSFCAGLHDFQF